MFGFGKPNRPSDKSEQPPYCSFCNKRLAEVRKLVAGPTAYICDECVGVCVDIIVDDVRVSASGEYGTQSLELQARLKAHQMNAHRAPEIVASERLPDWHVRCALCQLVVATDDAIQVDDRGVLCDPCVSAVQAVGAKATDGSQE
jgi:hypothetical protein